MTEGVVVKKEELRAAIASRSTKRPIVFKRSLPQRLYKYVDADVADTVGRGSFKLGLVSGYGNLENGRQDDIEGNAVVNPTNVSLAYGEDNADRQGLREMGIHGPGAVTINAPPGAVQFRTAGPDYIAYCLSKVPDSQTLLRNGDQVVFEIIDVEAFVLRMMAKIGILRVYAGEVIYDQRVFTNFSEPGFRGFHPLLKMPARESDGYPFQEEQEYRIFMKARNDISTSPYPEDPILARFLRRL